MLSKAKQKANARNQLFRQIHGCSFSPFISRAIAAEAITQKELDVLCEINTKLTFLKRHQFENTKAVGLNAKRRCSTCGKVAYWKVNLFGTEIYNCNKCKEQALADNKQNDENNWMITDFYPINPTE